MPMVSEPEMLPVAEARAGDARSWDALFRRYQLPLYTYVAELIRHDQASLDIVQETFVSAARHISTLREDGKFGSWLFGIAHQKCVQQWRRARPEPVELDEECDAADEAADSPCEALVRREDEAALMKLLQELPPPQRSVLLLHFIEDFSLDEIAEATGAALGTVKSRIHYAKRALRKLLEEQI